MPVDGRILAQRIRHANDRLVALAEPQQGPRHGVVHRDCRRAAPVDGDGAVQLPLPSPQWGRAHAIAVAADDKLLVAGFRVQPGGPVNNDFMLARLLDDGSFDPAFSGGQLVFTDVSGSYDRAFAMDLTPTNGIVVAGSGHLAESATAYVRYHNDLSTTLPPDRMIDPNVMVHPNPISASRLVTISGVDGAVMGIALIAQDGRRIHLPGRSWHHTSDHRIQTTIPPLASGLYTLELVSPGTRSYARMMVLD